MKFQLVCVTSQLVPLIDNARQKSDQSPALLILILLFAPVLSMSLHAFFNMI